MPRGALVPYVVRGSRVRYGRGAGGWYRQHPAGDMTERPTPTGVGRSVSSRASARGLPGRQPARALLTLSSTVCAAIGPPALFQAAPSMTTTWPFFSAFS